MHGTDYGTPSCVALETPLTDRQVSKQGKKNRKKIRKSITVCGASTWQHRVITDPDEVIKNAWMLRAEIMRAPPAPNPFSLLS